MCLFKNLPVYEYNTIFSPITNGKSLITELHLSSSQVPYDHCKKEVDPRLMYRHKSNIFK